MPEAGYYWVKCHGEDLIEIVQVLEDGTFWKFGFYETCPLEECVIVHGPIMPPNVHLG